MIDLNNVQSINLSQFFDSVKLRSGSGYHLVVDSCIVMFYMLMILMKFSFVPQTFFKFFFSDQDQDSTMKFIGKSYSSYTKDIYQIWCRSAKFLWKSKFSSRSGSGSWFYFGFQYQTYISYIEDTHQILFGSANSFESYCVHSKNLRTDRQTDRQTDGLLFFAFFVF